jgi:hypothetical protein
VACAGAVDGPLEQQGNSPDTSPTGGDAANAPSSDPSVVVPELVPPSESGVVGACDPAFKVAASPSLLLSREKLTRTLQVLLQDPSIESDELPADTSAGHFVHADSHRVNSDYVRQYQSLLERVSIRAASERLNALAPCPTGNEAACGATFVAAFLDAAFRRPATAEEVSEYQAFFAAQLAKHGYAGAVAQTLQAVLLDPSTMYRMEADASAADANGLVAIDAHALATRLSFTLTGLPPDAELRQAALSGQLATDEQIEAQALRLLATVEGRRVFDEFVRSWLGLDFQKITKSAALRGDAIQQPALIAGFEQSFSDFMDHVVGDGGATIEALLTSDELFLPADLQPLYATPGPRAGLLTHPAVMSQLAHEFSSPVLRGVFVRGYLMCSPVPPPPPGVDTKVPEPPETKTTRERYGLIETQAACSACHSLIHSVGFAFENYDALGRYREQENGVPIDASGSFKGFQELSGSFNGVVELSQQLAKSERIAECLTKNLYESGAARTPDALDQCAIGSLSAQLLDPATFNGDLKQLLVAMVKNPRFRSKPVDAPLALTAPGEN